MCIADSVDRWERSGRRWRDRRDVAVHGNETPLNEFTCGGCVRIWKGKGWDGGCGEQEIGVKLQLDRWLPKDH